MRNLNDAALLARLHVSGHRDQAAAELLDRYGPDVRRVAYSVLKSRGLTSYLDDATQQVWLALSSLPRRRLPEVNATRPLLPWLREFTRRVVCAFRRRCYRDASRFRAETDVGTSMSLDGLCADSSTVDAEFLEALQVTAAAFAEAGDVIPMLMLHNEQNAAQVAARCGRSTRTVYLHWSAALSAFHKVAVEGASARQSVHNVLARALRDRRPKRQTVGRRVG